MKSAFANLRTGRPTRASSATPSVIRRAVLVAVALAACGPARSTAAENLAPNPGAENLAPNPGAEEVHNGKPAGWGVYDNTPVEWGVSEEEARSGARSARFRVKGFGKDGYAVAGICVGKSDGFTAPNGIEVLPGLAYRFSAYVKGTGFTRPLSAQPWGFDAAGNQRDRSLPGTSFLPTDAWTEVSGTFTTGDGMERIVLMFMVYANGEKDVAIGATLHIDDVRLCVAADPDKVTEAKQRKRVKTRLPDKLGLPSMWTPGDELTPWREIKRRHDAGDEAIRAWVRRGLANADAWAARPDSYYLGLFRPETPFGAYTICCPIHPETSGYVPFQWDPDHPWRLTCPRCQKEGRDPPWYPNARYPDDGGGCRPTDEAWRATHDEAWGKKYDIPWDRWDGITRGHNHGDTFYFLGHAQWRIFFELTARRQILTSLAQAGVFARELHAPDSPVGRKAALYAHKAKVIMVTMARATLGDAYLRTAMGVDEAAYRKAVESLARDEDGKPIPYREYPGYRVRDSISDHTDDNPNRPIRTIKVGWWKNAVTIFPDHGFRDWAIKWLSSYALIQPAFTDEERAAGLDGIVERLLAVQEGDAVKLEAAGIPVREGIVDKGLNIADPVKMKGNLAGGAALAWLDLADILDQPRMRKEAAAAIHNYLHHDRGGYFMKDGFGCETSAHYTQVALGNLRAPLDVLTGQSEGFGPGDPFWDEASRSLNPYLDPTLEKIAYSTLLSMLPDGLCAPWVDSWVTERPQLSMAERIANAKGRVLARYEPWLDVARSPNGSIALRLKKAPTLPSYVLEDNGMAVMRVGEGLDQTFASVDWSAATGHSHDGPFNLLLYSARHEVFFDQGYLNNVTPTQDWMNSAEAHNTALVRTANGDPGRCTTWRGALRFFADTPAVKAVETAETDAAKLKAGMPADEAALFQRTVTLIETAAPGGAYVVDIFRLQGGATHDYFIHALGDRLEVAGLDVAKADDPARTLYDASGFGYRTRTGAKAIHSLRTGRTDGAFTAVWSDMADWRDVPPRRDAQARARMRMLAEPGTEVFLGKAFGQRYMDQRDVEQRVNVLCARRQADAYRETPDAFVAVIDARPSPADAHHGVGRLAVVRGDPSAVGVKIVHDQGTDFVLSTLHDDAETVFADPDAKRELALVGRLGVVRERKGADEPELLLLRGSRLVGGGRATTQQESSR
ncbi:MAG: carbohydrate binding domain-containing protein [Kiritimatiellia bacterium]|jgi:hypothetical protein